MVLVAFLKKSKSIRIYCFILYFYLYFIFIFFLLKAIKTAIDNQGVEALLFLLLISIFSKEVLIQPVRTMAF